MHLVMSNLKPSLIKLSYFTLERHLNSVWDVEVISNANVLFQSLCLI